MLSDKNDANIGFEINSKTLLLIATTLAIIAIGILSMSALGSTSLMFS